MRFETHPRLPHPAPFLLKGDTVREGKAVVRRCGLGPAVKRGNLEGYVVPGMKIPEMRNIVSSV